MNFTCYLKTLASNFAEIGENVRILYRILNFSKNSRSKNFS